MSNEVRVKILDEIAAGATPQQCADKYNIPAGTIRSWLFRAKRNATKTKPATKKSAARKPATKKTATDKRQNVFEIKLKDVDDELTEKQRLFCMFYIRNFNASTSAIRARYSEKTSYAIGHELGLLETAIRGPFSAFLTLCGLESIRQVNPVQKTSNYHSDQNRTSHSHHRKDTVQTHNNSTKCGNR